jgi:hypothetical protein
MPLDVTLTSIEFSTWSQYDSVISAIKCTYSDEQESKLFTKDGVQLNHTKVITFEPSRRVARV